MQAEGSSRAPASLFVGSGLVFLALALAFGTPLVEALHPAESLPPEAAREALRSRAILALVGLSLLGIGAGFRWRSPSRGLARASILALFLLAPVLLLERALRPFVEQSTTIYAPDPELGWRLVPGAEDDWLGVPVRINSRGLRGPERSLEKPAGTRRVLFLGDSVVFGTFLEQDELSIPARAEEVLARELSCAVECINAGVGGYAPWQERRFLEKDLAPYEPDLVVLVFVLNDVSEPSGLERFGGRGLGFQLEHTLRPGLLRWLRGSALAHFARELGARIEYGADARRGAAAREELSVYELLLDPNAERVQAAWRFALEELDGIARWCAERAVPLLIAVSPYTIQLERPELDAPQWILERFCGRRSIHFLDLAPPLRAILAERGWSDRELFLDALHPSERGCAIMAELIARRILAIEGWSRSPT